jgi:diguanylate cyclase (GGDEF)-like protein
MEASSITRRLLACVVVREWPWWRLPRLPRWYVGAVPVAALTLIGFAASQTSWHAADLVKFLLLLSCGIVSVVATSRIAYLQGGMTRDFLTVWVLPVAILLPPVYAVVTPIPLIALTQWRIHRGIVYRRVFSAAAIGLAYGAASLTWAVAVACCEIVGWLSHHVLLVTAVKLSDPTAKVADLELNREALQADFAQVDLGILVTMVVAVNPVLAVFGVPTVLLARRFMMHAQLLAQSRIDSKTGLLNAATWEREAEAEISRAVRTRSPLSVALIDIDHFKAVNDTHGHLVGDKVLRALSDALREQLRAYDHAGRFGGEEFVVLLPQTDEENAIRIAERLRRHVAGMSVPADDAARPGTFVRLTVSVGVAALGAAGSEVTDLLAAADAALYYAKQSGRNRTHVAPASVPLTQIVPMARQTPGIIDTSDTSARQ